MVIGLVGLGQLEGKRSGSVVRSHLPRTIAAYAARVEDPGEGAVIRRLLPAEVACAETIAPGDPAWLLEEEAALLDRAVARRVAEFAAGRWCAHRALAAIGRDVGPVLRGEQREPLWPEGVVGAITHKEGYCAAAVAPAERLAAVGIDAEEHEALPDGVLDRIALAPEAAWISARQGDGVHWDRVLFSAKESVFKAWFPIARRFLEFEGARVELAPAPADDDGGASGVRAQIARGHFEAALLDGPLLIDGRPLERLAGNYLVTRELILTAIALPR